MNESTHYRSGFVGLVGPTNAGKSTLFNALMNRKISIVSPKVQTTYHATRGIQHEEAQELILIDTPGFQKMKSRIPRLLNEVALQQARDADTLVWVFDVSNIHFNSMIRSQKATMATLKPKENTIIVLNKVDKIERKKLLPIIAELASWEVASDIIPLSALRSENLDSLKKLLREKLRPGEQYYPDDMVTDRPQSFFLTELVREKIYTYMHQELPYAVRIEMEESTPTDSKVPNLFMRIHVDSESRKAMVIGKKGASLKRIGTEARKEIEKLLGHQVCLKLQVDVEPFWRENSRTLKSYLELDA